VINRRGLWFIKIIRRKVCPNLPARLEKERNEEKKKEANISLLQAVEALRVARGRGSHPT
jgi:hypothetical protein